MPSHAPPNPGVPRRHPSRRTTAFGVVGFLLVLVVSSTSQAERPRVYAFKGATVVPAPGRKVESATVVIRDGLVEAVGRDVKTPPDAVEVEAKDLWIYPGLINAAGWSGPRIESDSGTSAPGSGGPNRAPRREPAPGPVHPISRIRPERQARDLLLPFEGDRKRDAETYRKLGFTTTLVAPPLGIFSGQSSAILLADDAPVADLILRDAVAQHLAFEAGSFGEGYPTSLMGAAAAIRQALRDGERYAVWSARYARDPVGMPRPEHFAAYEALGSVLLRRQPVVFSVDEPADALLADRLAREFNLDIVIAASGFEWEIADRIAATGRLLLLPVGFPDRPKVDDADEALDVTLRQLRRFTLAAEGPRRLHEAGVRFALTTRGLKNLADFPANVRKIIDAGLPEDVALGALTTVPARVLGIEKVTGTLEPGKIANLFLADGPLFAKDTKIRRVFVDGTDYPIEEKKKPKGNPNAVVDPRGVWSVVFELGGQPTQRTWTLTGTKGSYSGTAETRTGTVTFDRVELAGNVLTVIFPASEGRGTMEVTVIITGESFEGTAEMGPRSVTLRGTRTHGPEGGGR